MADENPDAPPWEAPAAAPSADIPPWERESMTHGTKTAEQKAQDEKASTAAESMAMGVTDPAVGGGQLVSEAMPGPIRKNLDAFNNWLADNTGGMFRKLPEGGMSEYVQQREKKHEERRGPDAGIDWARGVGGVLPAAAGGAITAPEQIAVRAGPWGVAATRGLVEAAKRVGGASATGAVAGVTQPAAGDSFWGEKIAQTGAGAVLGTVLGIGGEGVSKAVEGVGAYLARNNPQALDDEAIKVILRRMNQDAKAGGPTVQQVLDLVGTANQKGIPLTIADEAGHNTQGLAGQIARKHGEAKDFARRFLDERDKGAPERMENAIAQNLHGGSTMREATKMLLNARSAAARPAYDKLNTLEGIWSPRLQEFIDDPLLVDAMKRGYQIERLRALAEGRAFNPTQMGIDVDAQGNIKLLQVPNMQVLSIAKEGLDAIVASERNEITGRLTKMGKVVNDVRREYLGEIDKLDTKGIYRAARETWAGPSASDDAIRVGHSALTAHPEDISGAVDKMSEANREFVRIGIADKLRERLSKTGFAGDDAKALIKNPWTRQQLKPLFKSEKEFDAFVDSVSAENKMFQTKASNMGGSQTAERVAEDTSLERMAAGAGLAKGLSFNPFSLVAKARDAFQMYRDLGLKPNAELNEKIAKIIFQAPITQETRQAMQNAGPTRDAATSKLVQFGQALKQRQGGAEAGVAGAAGAGAGEVLGGQ